MMITRIWINSFYLIFIFLQWDLKIFHYCVSKWTWNSATHTFNIMSTLSQKKDLVKAEPFSLEATFLKTVKLSFGAIIFESKLLSKYLKMWEWEYSEKLYRVGNCIYSFDLFLSQLTELIFQYLKCMPKHLK